MVIFTPTAIQKAKDFLAKNACAIGIRLGLRASGCEGFTYVFEYQYTTPHVKDHTLNFDGLYIFIDPKSAIYLEGTTIDHKTTLMKSGFVFENPQAQGSCSCGVSTKFF